MRVVVTRPRHQAAGLARELEAAGLEVMIEPLLEIVPRADVSLDLDGVQAVLVTSANGAEALAAASPRRDMAVFAVGDATAAAAKAQGFADVTSARGAADDLAGLVVDRLEPAAGALVHASGQAVAGDLAGPLRAAGFTFRREVLYDSHPAARLSESLLAALGDGGIAGILFFSPRTAQAFVTLARRAEVDQGMGRIIAFCLSHAVGEPARALTWRKILVSERPEAAALLALVAGCAARA